MATIPFFQRAPTLFALIAALLAFALAAFAPQIFNDGDTWWHLAAGNWMLEHRMVLTQDVFSFTVAGKPWDAQEWLSEILMAPAFAKTLICRICGFTSTHAQFFSRRNAL